MKGDVEAMVARNADACLDPEDVPAVIDVVIVALLWGGYTVTDPAGTPLKCWTDTTGERVRSAD